MKKTGIEATTAMHGMDTIGRSEGLGVDGVQILITEWWSEGHAEVWRGEEEGREEEVKSKLAVESHPNTDV